MIRETLLSSLFVVLGSNIVFAQGPTTGRIEGTVTDERGAAISGASITVFCKTNGNERTLSTDEQGHYVVSLLPVGEYRITIRAQGFATAVLDPARVSITGTTRADVTMAVAGADVVELEVRSQLQHDGSQIGSIVDSGMISELPIATRNFTQILSLSPGVATYLPDSTGVGRNTQTISINGARMTQNNFQLNGIDANTMGTSSAINIAIPAPESIQEFKVQTSLFDASFGRSGGGNVQIITRSGGNEFHGTVYEYFRNDALNANSPFLKAAGIRRPVLKRNAFGATFGGPIKKNVSSFFLSYQGTRERNGASLLNSISSGILIADGLTDDRSEQTLLRTFAPKFPSGQPASSIDPVALALLNSRLPSGQFLIPTPQVNGRYFGSSISRFREEQLNINFDHRFSERNWFTAKVFLANAPGYLALPSFRGTGPNVPGFGADQRNDVRVISFQDIHSFGPSFFNEMRAGYNVHHNRSVPTESINDVDVGINRSTATTFPGLGLIRIAQAAGGVIFGTQTNIAPATPSVTTFADTATLTKSKHTIRVGAEIRFNEVFFNQYQFTRGQIDFANFSPNFLLGIVNTSTLGNGIADRKQRTTDYNFFWQDDWTLTSRLTLNLGLRYELDLPPYDTRGRIATFDPELYKPRASDGAPIGPPSAGFVQAGNVIPAYDLAGVPNVSKRVVTSVDPNNFAPRLGAAYAPFNSNRLVVRAGYGISYSRPTFQYVSTSVTTPPMYLLARRQSPSSFSNPFATVPPESQFPNFFPPIALSGTVLDRNIRTPYFQQYSASMQYEQGNQLIELAYVGSRGANLFRQVAINQSRLASKERPIVNEVTNQIFTTNSPQDAQLRAPFQGVEINSFFQNQTTARSSYNSFQASLTRRFSRNVQCLVSYTFAKSIDDASGTGGGAGIVGVVNPGAVAETSNILGNQLNLNANRGVSDFDRAHRFVMAFVWNVPTENLESLSTLTRLALSDWQLSGVVVAMSGLPIDIVDTGAGSFYGLANGSSALARPQWAPGATTATANSNIPVGYFFNPRAFARPIVQIGQSIPSSNGVATAAAIGTDIGNVGRNVLRGPKQSNIDLSVIKKFHIDEERSVEFHAEVFNLFNHVNFANPISDLNSLPTSAIDSQGRITAEGTFGRIISTSNNPRIIQLALKFSF